MRQDKRTGRDAECGDCAPALCDCSYVCACGDESVGWPNFHNHAVEPDGIKVGAL